MGRHSRTRRAVSALLAGVAGLSLLAGCATSVSLTKPAREAIRSVSVSDHVARPDDIYYHGRAQSVGMAFGLVGALIGAAAAEGPKEQLKAAMHEGQIDVSKIVRERFVSELTAAGAFPSIVEAGGDAELKLQIAILGFAQPHGFSAQLKPMLGVRGLLTKGDGTVVWDRYEYVTNLNDRTPSHTLEEYLGSPRLIGEAFTAAAGIVVPDLVKHLRGE